MINIKGVNYIEHYVYTEVINVYDEALGVQQKTIDRLEKTIETLRDDVQNQYYENDND